MRTKLIYLIVVIIAALTAYAFMPSNKGGEKELTKSLYKSDIKIIDIRTEPEWKQTGIVKGSYTITFFDEKGNYDVKDFLSKLNKIVSPQERFGLICRTGNRTTTVTKLLKEIGYKNVINLQGGVTKASRNGIPFEPYK